nr:Unknown Function [uncultured bacterium]
MLNWGYLIPAIILGTMGWMLYWFGLPMIGALAGAGVGATFGYAAASQIAAPWAAVALPAIGMVLGAIIGFIFIRAFQFYLFFAAGACFGGMLGFQIMDQPTVRSMLHDPGPAVSFLVVGLLALLGGFLCLKLRRYIVAAITSVMATFLLVMGLPLDWRGYGMVIGLVVFLAIQIGLVNRFVDDEKFDQRTRYRMNDDVPDTRAID